jgi:hypothetical protein
LGLFIVGALERHSCNSRTVPDAVDCTWIEALGMKGRIGEKSLASAGQGVFLLDASLPGGVDQRPHRPSSTRGIGRGVFSKNLEALERDLGAIAGADPVVSRLLTIPGIGFITGTALVATVGHIHAPARSCPEERRLTTMSAAQQCCLQDR